MNASSTFTRITPDMIRLLFAQTGGTHPTFNPLDADNPDNDLSSVDARRAGYSMMLTRGVFRRGGAPQADREWDVVAVADPHGFATDTQLSGQLRRFWQFSIGERAGSNGPAQRLLHLRNQAERSADALERAR